MTHLTTAAKPSLGCPATVHSSHAETDQFSSVADVASWSQVGLTTGVAQLAGEVMA